jgi:hypothetical protein
MPEEELDDDADEAELDDDDLDEEDLDEDVIEVAADDDDEIDEIVLVEDLPDGDVVAPEVVVADGAAAPPVVVAGEDDEEALDLDEELHPDDVEAPLDALLQEKTAAATMEDDEEELEDEEPDSDERGDGPAKIVPRRPGEFVCRSCFLVLPRHQLADEGRMFCRDCA